MNTCPKIQKELSAYIDQELSPSARISVEEHVRGCGVCQQRLAELKALSVGVMALPRLHPAPGFLAAVRRKIAPRPERQRKAGPDRWLRPAWLKVPLEAMAVMALALLVMRLGHSVNERFPKAHSIVSAAKPATALARTAPAPINKLAPNRLIGSATPESPSETQNLVVADVVMVHAKDFDDVQNQVQLLAAALNGRIAPPPRGQALAHVLFVELPRENQQAFQSRLQADKLLGAVQSVTNAAPPLGKNSQPVLVEVRVLPPSN